MPAPLPLPPALLQSRQPLPVVEQKHSGELEPEEE